MSPIPTPDEPFPTLADSFLSTRPFRPSWRREVDRYLHGPLRSLPHHPVKQDVLTLLSRLKGSTHNHVLGLINGIYSSGRAQCLTERNPACDIPRQRVPSRDRVLSRDELRRIWAATDDGHDFSRIVRLLLLTGCRRDEIGDLRWSEISRDDDGRWYLDLSRDRTKNGRPHLVPLSPLAISQLPRIRSSRAFLFGKRKSSGFNSWSKYKRLIDARSGVTGWRLHDLRRTAVTEWNESGLADQLTIELAVNHASGVRSGVAGTYNRAQRLAERRALMADWATLVERIVSGTADQPGMAAEKLRPVTAEDFSHA